MVEAVGVSFTVSVLVPTALTPLREAFIAVAAEAFAAPPWNESPDEAVSLIDRMWDAMDRRDFTAIGAFDGTQLIGFSYGYTDDRLTAMDGAFANAAGESFEVVELAVAPAYQGRGVGKALNDALLAQTPSPRLLLTHPEAAARRAYLRWGWTELDTVTTATGRPIVLMGHRS